jgi:hypothetical protein
VLTHFAVHKWPLYVAFCPPTYATVETHAPTPEHEPVPTVVVDVVDVVVFVVEVVLGGGVVVVVLVVDVVVFVVDGGGGVEPFAIAAFTVLSMRPFAKSQH